MAKTPEIFGVVLLLVCAADLRVVFNPTPQRRPGHRTGRRLETPPRPPDWPPTARRCPPRVSTTPPGTRAADASHGAADPGGRRRLPEPVLWARTCSPRCPQDPAKQDWWYCTTFTAPADRQTYRLDFPGINYRAEIWLNGHPRRRRPADRRHVQRPRPRRQPVDPARQAQHPGGEGHPERAMHPGRRRRRVGGQLVRLDQLALPGLPRSRTRTRPTATCSSWTETPASGSRYTRTSGAVSIGAATVNSPNRRCPTPTAPG